MKTLYLLRHAKSCLGNSELKDFERPLSDRGLADAPAMGARLLADKKEVACVVTSPAIRARTTAQLVAEVVGYPADEIISNPELYFAGAAMFLKATTLLDEDCESAMIVGHNPAITEFVNAMAKLDIDNVPTCGLVELRLPVDNWADAKLGCASLVKIDFPKNGS